MSCREVTTNPFGLDQPEGLLAVAAMGKVLGLSPETLFSFPVLCKAKKALTNKNTK